MSGDVPWPCPKESRSTFERSFALCARGSAGSYVSGRTPSAILPTGSGVLPQTLFKIESNSSRQQT